MLSELHTPADALAAVLLRMLESPGTGHEAVHCVRRKCSGDAGGEPGVTNDRLVC